MAKVEMILKKKFGKNSYTFVVNGDSFKNAVIESSKLSFGDVDKCDICESDELFLGGHVTKEEGHEYAYVRCKKCRSTLNFGTQKKATDVNYLTMREGAGGKKVLDWVKYEPKNTNE